MRTFGRELEPKEFISSQPTAWQGYWRFVTDFAINDGLSLSRAASRISDEGLPQLCANVPSGGWEEQVNLVQSVIDYYGWRQLRTNLAAGFATRLEISLNIVDLISYPKTSAI